MPVITVNGVKSENDLGVTDIHEHILCDFSKNLDTQKNEQKKLLSEQKINIENLGIVTQNPNAIKDNLILSNEFLAVDELMKFKKAGGRTIVDATTLDLGRNHKALKNISQALDINIITSTGYYIKKYHSPKVKYMSIDEIYEEMIKEIQVGISNTNIRAGIIGEIGTSETIFPDERKVLVAAARVNNKLGIPIMVHLEPSKRLAINVIKILSKYNANLEKVYLCHLDSNYFEQEYYDSILKTGVYIGLDTFGEVFTLNPNYGPSDLDRIKTLSKLIEKGYINQILIGCDICLKCRLHKFGGWGYDHIINNVIPAIRRIGLSDKQIEKLLIDNPKKYLNIENIKM